MERNAGKIIYFILLGALTLDSFRPTTAKNKQLLNENKLYNKAHSKINNVYFNDYIDMQFRINKQSIKNVNNFPAVESPPVIGKNINKGSGPSKLNGLSNLMVIEKVSMNNNQRNAQSAKQKI